jgi:hypothetical protein
MKKHIISYSESNQTQIGRGSVILIKGKAEHDGRKLYATNITGYVEIKSGVKMVFLGDQMYRVIYREGKFFGLKIEVKREEGLMGVLNLRNNGIPSIVLNHNKTPFHWITTGFTDIGSALRELGSGLFSHDLILESNKYKVIPVLDKVFIETMKVLLKKGSSKVSIKSLDIEGNGTTYFGDDYSPEESESVEFEWFLDIEVDVLEDSNDLKDELINQGIITGIIDPVLSDFLDTSDTVKISIDFESVSDWNVWYDPGSYSEPPDIGAEMNYIENDLRQIYIADLEYAVLPNKTESMSPEAKELLTEFIKKVSKFDRYDFYKLIS